MKENPQMNRKPALYSLVAVTMAFVACGGDDSNSVAAKDDRTSSSSAKSSSSRSNASSSSFYSEDLGEGIMPSGTYDCRFIKCMSTEFLNQEMYEAGKYGEILDERDNQVYNTIKIGEQVWLAQNLNYYDEHSSHFGYCLDNQQSNCKKFGHLYSYRSNVGCPDGWHIADEFEWQRLIAFVGDSSTACQKLSSQKGWSRDGVDVSGTDDYGFSMVAAGARLNTDEYSEYRYYAEFLLRYGYRNRDEEYTVKFFKFYDKDEGVVQGYISNKSYIDKFTAVSIRCIKDE